jgi:hypothetical protein
VDRDVRAKDREQHRRRLAVQVMAMCCSTVLTASTAVEASCLYDPTPSSEYDHTPSTEYCKYPTRNRHGSRKDKVMAPSKLCMLLAAALQPLEGERSSDVDTDAALMRHTSRPVVAALGCRHAPSLVPTSLDQTTPALSNLTFASTCIFSSPPPPSHLRLALPALGCPVSAPLIHETGV